MLLIERQLKKAPTPMELMALHYNILSVIIKKVISCDFSLPAKGNGH
jgi:hypothetical protein